MPETKQFNLPIVGMTCANCVSTVERNLTKVPGVHRAQVNLSTERAAVDFDPGQASLADMLARVRRILDEELTQKQREALVLLGLQDMPMEEAAKRMKTNRNALYKLLHDARLRLKRRMALEDITPQDLLTAFEQK